MAPIVVVVSALVAQEKGLPASAEASIRSLLEGEEGIDRVELTKLGGFTPAAFPLYSRILLDPKEDSYIVQRTLGVLSFIKADRSTFLESTVSRLSHKHSGVRGNAVILLAQIGTDRDTPPVVALLSDEDYTVSVAAAETIRAIGGERDLAALTTWLASTSRKRIAPEFHEQYDSLREYVTKARDGLRERLDKAKKLKS